MAIEDFAPILLGVMWTQVVIAIAFIGLRMYTRYFILRSVGLDDIIMLFNLVSPLHIPNKLTLNPPALFHRLRRLHNRRNHLRHWQKVRRGGTISLFQSHNVGSNRPGHLHSGNRALEKLGRCLPSPYCGSQVARLRALVLHRVNINTVYNHYNAVVSAVYADCVSVGPQH
jgi:hypothetical protein